MAMCFYALNNIYLILKSPQSHINKALIVSLMLKMAAKIKELSLLNIKKIRRSLNADGKVEFVINMVKRAGLFIFYEIYWTSKDTIILIA